MLSYTHAEIRKNVKHFFKRDIIKIIASNNNAKILFSLNISNTTCTWVGQVLEDQLHLKLHHTPFFSVPTAATTKRIRKKPPKKYSKTPQTQTRSVAPGRWTQYSAYLIQDCFSKEKYYCIHRIILHFYHKTKCYHESEKTSHSARAGPITRHQQQDCGWPLLQGKALPLLTLTIE